MIDSKYVTDIDLRVSQAGATGSFTASARDAQRNLGQSDWKDSPEAAAKQAIQRLYHKRKALR